MTGFYFVEVMKVKTRVCYRKLISPLEIFVHSQYSFHCHCSLLVQTDCIFDIYFRFFFFLRINSEPCRLEPKCARLAIGTCGKAEELALLLLQKDLHLESYSPHTVTRTFWSVWFERSLFSTAFPSLLSGREYLCWPSYTLTSRQNTFLTDGHLGI